MMALATCHDSMAFDIEGARLSLDSLTLSSYCVVIVTDCATEALCNNKLM